MKKILIVSLAALFAFGCAASNAETRMAAAGKEITDLQAELTATRQPAGTAPAAAVFPPAYVPPPHAPVRSVPENWAWLYEEPAGCQDGPLALDIVNQTDLFIMVMIDGKGIQTRGAYGTIPHLPPRQTVHVCLDRLGKHNISGIVYARRYNEMVEVSRFSQDHDYNRLDRHTLWLDQDALR